MRSLKEALVHKHMDSHIKELDMDFENLKPGVLVKVIPARYEAYWLCITTDLGKKLFPEWDEELDDEKGVMVEFSPKSIYNLNFLEISSYKKHFPSTNIDKKITISKMWELDRSTLSELKDKNSIIAFLEFSYEDPEGFKEELGL